MVIEQEREEERERGKGEVGRQRQSGNLISRIYDCYQNCSALHSVATLLPALTR